MRSMTMTAALDSPGESSRSARASVALVAAVVAITLVGVSVVTPWLSVYRGLDPIPGFQLDGGSLAGVAIAALAFLAVAARSGGAIFLRPLAVIGALIVTADAAFSALRIEAFLANPGPAAALIQPSAGVGAYLLVGGGLALFTAAIAAPLRAGRLGTGVGPRLALATALFTAGWIHLLLTPQHVAESAILGFGFLAAGIAQVVLSGAVLARPRAWMYEAIVAVNVALLFSYGYAVLVGLPFGGHDHGAAGLVVGSGEPIDLAGTVSKAGELISLVGAFVLVGHQQAPA